MFCVVRLVILVLIEGSVFDWIVSLIWNFD